MVYRSVVWDTWNLRVEFKGFQQSRISLAHPEQDELYRSDKKNEDGRGPLDYLLPILHALEVLDQSSLISATTKIG